MTTNWKPPYAPVIAKATTLARATEPLRKMPSRTSGWAVRLSTSRKAAASAATTTSEPSVRRLSQPAPCASVTVNTSRSTVAVPVMAPSTS